MTTRFRYSWLFDAAPLIDVGLPGDVTAEHAALLRLQAHTLAPARDPAAEERAAVDRLLAAARSGDDLPGRVDESWRDDQRDRDAAAAALAQARAEQAGRLNDLVLDRRDTLIGALNPVLAELVDATAEVAPHLDPAQPMRPVDVARASNTVRKSVVKGEELAARFGAVRDTWGRLFGLPPTAKQQAHVPAFAVVRRADRLIGQDRHGRPVADGPDRGRPTTCPGCCGWPRTETSSRGCRHPTSSTTRCARSTPRASPTPNVPAPPAPQSGPGRADETGSAVQPDGGCRRPPATRHGVPRCPAADRADT